MPSTIRQRFSETLPKPTESFPWACVGLRETTFMPDPGRFSNPYTSTLPVGVNEPPVRAQYVETLMYWLNQEAASHGWPAFTWQRHNGTSLENFTPQNAAPFGLTGKPWHVKQVWNQIRTAFGSIGPSLFQDYATYSPYNVNGSGAPQVWQPSDPGTIGQHGKMALSPDAVNLINNVPTSGPSWTALLATRQGAPATTSVNTYYPYNNTSQVASTAAAAWTNFQNASWTFSPGPASCQSGNVANYGLAAYFTFGTSPHFDVGISYSSTVTLLFRWIGGRNLKNSVGMVPLVGGTLPVGVKAQYLAPYNASWNPWNYTTQIVYGTLSTYWPDDTTPSIDAVAAAVLAQLPGTQLAAIPEPTTVTEPTGWAGTYGNFNQPYKVVTSGSFTSSNLADFSPVHNATGGSILWLALCGSTVWGAGANSSAAPPVPALQNPAAIFIEGAGDEGSESLVETNLISCAPDLASPGYWNPLLRVNSQSAGALGIALPFASGE